MDIQELLINAVGYKFSKIGRHRDIRGSVYYKVLDICKLFGLKNTTVTVRGGKTCIGHFAIAPDEIKQFGGSPKSALYITEAAVYKLILKSKKSIPQMIKNMLSEMVLPQIMNTGEYKSMEAI